MLIFLTLVTVYFYFYPSKDSASIIFVLFFICGNVGLTADKESVAKFIVITCLFFVSISLMFYSLERKENKQ